MTEKMNPFDGDLPPDLAMLERLQAGNTPNAIAKRSRSMSISGRMRKIRERISNGEVTDEDMAYLSEKFVNKEVFYADLLNVLDSIVHNPEANMGHVLKATQIQAELGKVIFPEKSMEVRMKADDINEQLKRLNE